MFLQLFFLAIISWVSDAQTEDSTPNCYNFPAVHEELIQLLNLNSNSQKTRPLFSWRSAINTYVDLYVTSIIDVNEKAQSLTTQIKLIIAWDDWKFGWYPPYYCGIETLVYPRNMFWTPDIGIVESIKTEFGTRESPNVQLRHWGYLLTSDILSLTTACKMDLYTFPFDIQTCKMTFQSTAYSKKNLLISPLNDANVTTFDSKKSFEAQGEWELVNISITSAEATVVWDKMDQLIYQITIKRRPLLYFINIILPVFFFLLLDVISFFIDAGGSDKLSFKVTLLLSISVLLLILNDTLPSTADKIPLIGIYCCGIFCLIGISIVETIFVNYLMAKGAVSRSEVETTVVVSERDDGVRDRQNLPDSVIDQNKILKSFCWTRLARIIDVIFLVLYLTASVVFLSVLWKLWVPPMS